MAYYLSRLSPPRPSFLADMTPDEQALMRAHQEYWRSYVEVGRVAAIGAVADPAGAWGVAIIEAESVAEVESLQARDPVLVAGRGFAYQNFVMPTIALRPAESRAAVSSVTP
ncbi:MAG: YciI family protein [Roseiarcus sp.]|jgi:uncharacterized protein YciI